MKHLIATLSLLSFTGCDCSHCPPSGVMSPEWFLFEPKLHPEVPFPHGEISWAVDDSVPEALTSSLVSSAEEWRLVLGCNFNATQVSPAPDTHILFSCADDDHLVGGSYSATWVYADGFQEDNSRHVILAPRFCKTGGNALSQHAWSSALGFPSDQDSSDTWAIMGFSIDIEQRGGKQKPISGLELDGLRIFAKKMGAPGCGENEPKWSWDKKSVPYYTHPSENDIDKWLQLSSDEQAESSILHKHHTR